MDISQLNRNGTLFDIKDAKAVHKSDVESALSSTSENPVQNKVVNGAINSLNNSVRSLGSAIEDNTQAIANNTASITNITTALAGLQLALIESTTPSAENVGKRIDLPSGWTADKTMIIADAVYRNNGQYIYSLSPMLSVYMIGATNKLELVIAEGSGQYIADQTVKILVAKLPD